MFSPLFRGFFFPQRFWPVLLLAFAARVPAAAPSGNLDASACTAQSASFLNARLAVWQQRLNLTSWKVSVVFAHRADLKPKTLGNIHWDKVAKTAVVRVLDPSDYQSTCRAAQADMEVTLVHELVHLELSALPRSPASRRDEELAVIGITNALLGLDHGNGTVAAEMDRPPSSDPKRDASPAHPDASRSHAEAPPAAQ